MSRPTRIPFFFVSTGAPLGAIARRLSRGLALAGLAWAGILGAEPAATIQPISSAEEFTVNYQKPHTVLVSPDGRRLAYEALRGSRKVVVLDGKESPPYSDIERMKFTADSSKLVFVGKRGKTSVLVTMSGKDVQESPAVAAIRQIYFGPQGNRVVASFQREGKSNMGMRDAEVFFDDQEGPFENAGLLERSVSFSADGKDFAYGVYRPIANNPNERLHHLVYNGVAGAAIMSFIMEGDESFPLYFARLGGKPAVITLVGTNRFSKTGNWIAQAPDGSQRILQANALRPSDRGLRYFVLSDNREHYAYLDVYTPENATPYEISQGKVKTDYRVCLDGKELARYQVASPHAANAAIRNLTLSSDGRRIAYSLTTEPNVTHVYVDDQKGDFDYADCSQIVFSPDGKRTASVVYTQSREMFVLADGKEYGPYVGADQVRFSPDSKRLLFRSSGNNSEKFLIVDGKKFPTDEALNLDEAEYLPDGTIAFLVGLTRFNYEDRYSRADEFLPALFTIKDGATRTIPLGGPPIPDLEKGGKIYVSGPDGGLPAGLRTVPAQKMPLKIDAAIGKVEVNSGRFFGGSVLMIAVANDDKIVLVDGRPGPKFGVAPFEERFFFADGKVSFYTVADGALARVSVAPARVAPPGEVANVARVEPTAWPVNKSAFIKTVWTEVAPLSELWPEKKGTAKPAGGAAQKQPAASTAASKPVVAATPAAPAKATEPEPAPAAEQPVEPAAESAPANAAVPAATPAAANDLTKVVGGVAEAGKEIGQALGGLFKKKKPAPAPAVPPAK